MADEAGTPDAAVSLLLAPPLSTAGERACIGHLRGADGPPERSLAVLLTDRPEARVSGWRAHASAVPDEAAIIASQRSRDPPSDVEIVHLDSPGDLSGLGVTITDRLEAWPATGRSAFCFDSVTALLQFVETDAAVRFVEALRPRLAEADVVGHLHLNPRAHEEATVSRFERVSDGVIVVDHEEPAFPGGRADS